MTARREWRMTGIVDCAACLGSEEKVAVLNRQSSSLDEHAIGLHSPRDGK